MLLLLYALYSLQMFHERGLFWYVAMDYRAWWGAAQVICSDGFSQLYDPQTMRTVQLELNPYGQGPRLFEVLPFAYLPIFAVPFLPLAFLSPLVGYTLFTLASLLIIVVPLVRLGRELRLEPGWVFLGVCSLPVFLDLFYAQTSGFLTLVGVEFLLSLRRGKPFQAGLWLSLWLLKPQNFLVLGLALLLGPTVRRGALSGALGIVLGSLAVGGLSAMDGYVALLTHYAADYGNYPSSMHNWRMLGYHLTFTYSRAALVPVAVGMGLTLGAVLSLWRRRGASPELLYLGTVAASLCLSWHSHTHTSCALLPALLVLKAQGRLRGWALALWAFLPGVAFVCLEFWFPVSLLSYNSVAIMLLAANLGWLGLSLALTRVPAPIHDGRAGLILFLSLVAAQAWSNLPVPDPEVMRFGWEHGNIAEALARGWGFADAMGPGSGPTAWMPPILPWLYALTFHLWGVRTLGAAVVLMLLKSAALAGAFYLQRRVLAASPWAEHRQRLTWLWIGYLVLDRTWILSDLLDTWLTLLLSCLALAGLAARGWALPLLAGVLLPLGSPPLAAGYALLWGVRVLRHSPRGRAIAVCGCVLVAAELWTTRNALVVGRPYPVKSNLAYDYVQAQIFDDDGVITASTMFIQHPCNPGNPNYELYRLVGEKRFLEEFQRQTRPPPDYWRRVGRRLSNAFWYMRRSIDIVGVADTLDRRDVRILRQRGVFGFDEHGMALWLFLEEPPESFARRAHNWGFHDRNEVMRSRWQAADGYRRQALVAEGYLYSLSHALLPSLAILVGWLRRNRHPLFREGVALYLIYLAPYILVSHYDRYQTAAFGLQAWLIFLAFTPPSREGQLAGGPP